MVGLFVLAGNGFSVSPFAVIANRVCAKALSVPANAQPDAAERFRAREAATTDAPGRAAGAGRFHAAANCHAMVKGQRGESRAAGPIHAAPPAGAEDHSVAAFRRSSFHRVKAIHRAMA